jgi:serine protease inhibitor
MKRVTFQYLTQTKRKYLLHRQINAWVEDQTNNLIRNLLSSNDITPDTRLVLINCIYFKVNISLKYLTEKNVLFRINLGCMEESI